MNDIEQLRGFFDRELQGAGAALDKQRRSILWRILVAYGVTLALAVVLFVTIEGDSRPVWGAVALALGGLVTALWTARPRREYRAAYKTAIIEPLVKFIDPSLVYEANRCIAARTFDESGIFRQRIDEYGGDDLVHGEVAGTQMEFSEVHAANVTVRRTSGGRSGRRHTQRKRHPVFDGLFFTAELGKDLHGKTQVLSDHLEGWLGGWVSHKLQGLNPARDAVVALDDPAFEKEFSVYSTDTDEARDLLSPSVRRRILELRHKARTRVKVAFARGRVYAAIPCKGPLLEAPTFTRSAAAFNPVREHYELLKMGIGLVEDLRQESPPGLPASL
jgi:hypothetical protein